MDVNMETLLKELSELQVRVTALEAQVDANVDNIVAANETIANNYADLTTQIDGVEIAANDAETIADEANDRSLDNENAVEEIKGDLESISGDLTSLEDSVTDMILTGADR